MEVDNDEDIQFETGSSSISDKFIHDFDSDVQTDISCVHRILNVIDNAGEQCDCVLHRSGDVSHVSKSFDVQTTILSDNNCKHSPLPQREKRVRTSRSRSVELPDWRVDDVFWLNESGDDDLLRGDNDITVLNASSTNIFDTDDVTSDCHSGGGDHALNEDQCLNQPTSATFDTKADVFYDLPHVKQCAFCTATWESREGVHRALRAHRLIQLSGCPNARGSRIPVDSNLNIASWREKLVGYHDQEVVEFLQYGWPVGVEGRIPDTVSAQNHKGAREFASVVSDHVISEVKRGRVIGPLKNNPFDTQLVLSPLNTVPKKESEARRVILDLSFPRGTSVNDHIPKDSYLGVTYKLTLPTVDTLVDDIKTFGPGCLLYKRDLKQAYRQIPIDPGDVHLLGYRIDGHLYCDAVLPMGLRTSCQACQRVTSAVSYAFSKMGRKLVNYIDDLAGAEIGSSAVEAFDDLGALLNDLGLEESATKACSPNTRMVFLGIEFDTIQGTLTIPPAKLAEVKQLLTEWDNKQVASKRDIQSLVGSLNFLSACVRPGRIFTARILNVLRTMTDDGPIDLDARFKQDVRWWARFAPLYNGVSLMPLNEWCEPDEVVACDACLDGCGGWSEGRYFHAKFPQFIATQGLHINALELLTIVVALKMWGRAWKGSRIKLKCDNYTAVTVINTGRSRDAFLQACLREICFLAALFECEIKAVHIPGQYNRLPDLLSRWDLSNHHRAEFARLTKHIVVTECHVPDSLFAFTHSW